VGNRRRGKNQIARKVPKGARTVGPPERVPRQQATADYQDAHPSWSFSILDRFAPVGGWVRLTTDDHDELLERFQAWEKSTWHDILMRDARNNHRIDVDRCCAASQQRLKFLGLDDLDQLVSLRVNTRARVIGILDRGVFKLLWWDPEHEVCPSPMPHT
jgi:hypothetical protein